MLACYLLSSFFSRRKHSTLHHHHYHQSHIVHLIQHCSNAILARYSAMLPGCPSPTMQCAYRLQTDAEIQTKHHWLTTTNTTIRERVNASIFLLLLHLNATVSHYQAQPAYNGSVSGKFHAYFQNYGNITRGQRNMNVNGKLWINFNL